MTQWSAGKRGGLVKLLRGAQCTGEMARKTRLPHHPVLQLILVFRQQFSGAAEHRRSMVVGCRRPGSLRIAGALNGPSYIIGRRRTDVD
jgi:hypothetical protein